MADWLRSGIKKKRETSSPLFKTNGAMIDTSRNPVPTVKTVKYMLRKMALMGMNTYMLYTEDTYEIDGLPYFGHLRGRYTKAELKELDAYAAMLGIELIPCIQVLGHLATYLKHPAATAHRDTPNCLLVGAEETYRLIDDMLRTISECFTTRRLHIGMDETHDLGTGASFDKNGYRERRELYFEHLRRVTDMAKGYGFRPMMWKEFMQTEEFKNVWMDTHIYMMMHPESETKDFVNLILGEYRSKLREMSRYFPIVVGEWCIMHPAKGLDAMSGWEKKLSYRMIAEAQLTAWDTGAGFFFWSYKLDSAAEGWDYRSCVEKGWIPEVIGQ